MILSTPLSSLPMARQFGWLLVFGGFLVSMGSVVAATNTAPDLGAANPVLVKFQEQYVEEVLVTAGPKVHVAFGYEYSNFSFVEGTDGIIVIDTGWFPDASARALARLRQTIKKPIVAIIYTHVHHDHYGGAVAFTEENPGQKMPVIYGPKGWKEMHEYTSSVLQPMIQQRAFSQFGMILPRGVNGTVGSGVGKVPTAKGTPVFIPPTVTITERTTVTIAGVTMEIISSPGDIYSSHMMVWLPAEKVLFTGDVLGGTFPYIETARFEMDRHPEGFVDSIDTALMLQPDYLVSGHGRVLLGSEDVEEVLGATRDVIQYLVDQVDRLTIKGYSADQMIDEIELPSRLANHPDLQPHYHRVAWMIRGMYLKRAGFVGDVMDLATLTESQESQRLVKLLGGAEATVAAANTALADNDPRWAARLATYALHAEPGNKQALQVRLTAFKAIASETISANERNYLLSAVLTESGAFDWKMPISKVLARDYVDHPSGVLLERFRVRVVPGQAKGKNFTAEIEIEGEVGPHYWNVSSGVLRYSDAAVAVDGTIKMDRATLLRLFAGQTTMHEAVTDGSVTISGAGDIQALPSIIE
jgi:alkyl sulfatase BDS1-like metallo-beta-lactamase superfamily hydrolase